MSEPTPKRISPFETIRRRDEQGEDYWTARELMPLLGYSNWQDFATAIERAIEDCKASDRNVERNFRDPPKKSGRGRPGKDYLLTRYACRLIVMAARAPGTIAAHARTYFSGQVEAAETMDAQLVAIHSSKGMCIMHTPYAST